MTWSLSGAWRMAALEPYTDAPSTTAEWLRALELGADAASFGEARLVASPSACNGEGSRLVVEDGLASVLCESGPSPKVTEAEHAVYDAALDAAIEHRLILHKLRKSAELDVPSYLAGLKAVRKVEELLEPLRGVPSSRAFELSVADRDLAA